jgi:prophage DNA circulation protein
MAWADKLLPGSFRGVPFVVEASDGDIGRRVALHEYPLRDKPYAEDLGRKARRFTLELFVHGVDYMAGRDALINAIEQSGSGKLVHPYLGEMTVTITEARGPRESTREGGLARFSITFVEAGEAVFPSAVTDGAATVTEMADLAEIEVLREFAETFDVTGQSWIADHAVSLIGQFTSQIDAIKNLIPGLPSFVIGFAADLAGLAATAESLIRTPADLAVAMYDLVAGIAQLPDRPLRALDAYRPLYDFLADEPEIAQTTTSRRKQAANQAAMKALVRRAAVVEAARTAASAEFTSLDQAISYRDELADQLDLQMDTADDQSYAVLADLRAELVRYVAATAGNLARLISYTPPATLPALVLAHRLYQDAGREAEIVDRNSFAHPGFVPGGVALEVLSNV